MVAEKKPNDTDNTAFESASGLTFRQKRFAEYYIVYGNKAEAARLAGFSKRSAREIGAHLFANSNVRAYIDDLVRNRDTDVMMSIAEAKQRITSAARGEMMEDVIVMTSRRDTKGGHSVTVTEPMIIQKHISARDQLESFKRYIELLLVNEINTSANDNKSTDDKLLDELRKRKIIITIPEGVIFEEDKDADIAE